MTPRHPFLADQEPSSSVPTLTEVVSLAELTGLRADAGETNERSALDEAAWRRLAPRVEALVSRAVRDVLAAHAPELAEAVRAAVVTALRDEEGDALDT